MGVHAATALLAMLLAAEGGAPKPGPAPPAAPVFEIDGKPFRPWVLSLSGDPDHPRPGDVVRVDGIFLTLGEAPAFQFRTTDDGTDGRLWLLLPDGKERLVGARTKWTLSDDRRHDFIVRNLLEPISDDEMKGLWGVHLDGWNEAVAAKVARIDPATTCVALTDSCGGPGREDVRPMPPLPAGLRALVLDENSSEGMTDLSPLGAQESLRLFVTSGFSRQPLDLSLLAKCRDLRLLRLGRANLRSPEALANFTALRSLDLSGNGAVADLAFARGMAELRRLDIDGAPVAKLPAGPLPALRELRVMSSPAPDAAVAVFAKAHPKCRVWHRWNGALAASLGAADRVRVRSGGLCHRRPAEETTLFEEKRPAEVRKVLAMFEVEEGASGFHCMCCGNPTFEFYRGTELIGSLGFHHGRSVRWPGGWPGDGMLKGKSGDVLVGWLAVHGCPGPAAEREEERKRDEAAARMWRRYGEILAPVSLDELRRQEGPARRAFLESKVPDAAARGALALRLYGCRRGSWQNVSGLDGWIEDDVLKSLPKEALGAACRSAAADPDGAAGLARWLFEDRHAKDLDAPALKEVLPAAGRAGLADPRPGNRKRTLAALEDLRGEAAVALLREALAGAIVPGPAPASDAPEPGGMVVFRPGGDEGPPEEASLPAAAAWYLGKMKDRASLSRIRELAAAAKGTDAEVLARAAAALEGK